MTTLIQFCLIALQWIASLIVGGWLFITVLGGAFVAAILAAIAFVGVFPPLQRWIEAKLPFWQPKLLKLMMAVILLIASLIATPGSSTKLAVCQAAENGACAEHEETLEADQLDIAYVAVRFPRDSEATEVGLELAYEADGAEAEVVYTATQPVSDAQAGQTQFELPVNELPIGAYTASVAIADTTISEAFELTGNLPRLNQVSVCSALEQATCPDTTTLYLADSLEALYVSAAPQHVRAEIPVSLTVNYISEPGERTLLNTVTETVSPDATTFNAEIPLPSFAVGTYEISIASAAKDFLSDTETLTVWHSSEALATRVEGALSDSITQLSDLKLCEQVLTAEEIEQLEAALDTEEETLSEDNIEDIDDSDRCFNDNAAFPDGIQTIAVDTDIGIGTVARPMDGTLNLTYIWRYAEDSNDPYQEVHTKTVPIEPDLSTFVYTLTGPEEGYPPGNYEVIVFLETDAARPIRREFRVGE